MGYNACILINTGTPEKFDEVSAKRFLLEFLGDRHVVDLPKFARVPLSKFVAERRAKGYSERAKRVAATDSEGNILPRLFKETEDLARKTSEISALEVRAAYLYGERNIDRAVAAARANGASNILAIPLFPQNCWATTASAKERFFECKRPNEKFFFKESYFDDPLYVASLRMSLGEAINSGYKPFDAVLVTFHGVPVSYLKKSPYLEECLGTFKALEQNFSDNFYGKNKFDVKFFFAWQSNMKFGTWTSPSAEEVAEKILLEGRKNLAVLPAGFSCDCTETLVDLGEKLRGKFIESGGENFTLLPCLNGSLRHAQLMAKIISETPFK